MMALLQDRVAIISGASSGIGRAIALRYANEGAAVIIADMMETPLEGGAPTAEVIAGQGGRAWFAKTDIADWTSVDRLVGDVVDRHGRLDVMVNNSAIYTSTNLLETSLEQWQRVVDVNLTGFFLCAKRAVMQMRV